MQDNATSIENVPAVTSMNVELGKETLDTMLDGLGKIRDQLNSVANKWSWQKYCYILHKYSICIKDEWVSEACFFNAPIWLNPTTKTPIPDHPARFLFLAPIAKCLSESFPHMSHPSESMI